MLLKSVLCSKCNANVHILKQMHKLQKVSQWLLREIH